MGESERRGWVLALVQALGKPVLWLRSHQVLWLASSLGALAIVLASAFKGHPAISICSGALIFLATALDRLADEADAVAAELDLASSTKAAEVAARAHLVFQEQALAVAQEKGDARETAKQLLRVQLAAAAARAIGPAARATYYTLSFDELGTRILGDPKHGADIRDDRSDRPFIEREDGPLSVWQTLDAHDVLAEVIRFPAEVEALTWDIKPYRCYINIPVKCGTEVFGMLSVNSSDRDDITPAQRVVLISMARTFGTVLAVDS